MYYISTRGKSNQIESSQAILKGLADDGGLFIPNEIPRLNLEFVKKLLPLNYQERAVEILEKFLTDYTKEELIDCVKKAYNTEKFDTEKIAPVANLNQFHVLELWHGATSAFKDMALQLLPQLLQKALNKQNETNDIYILVATSGDTGKAALAGFADVAQTKMMVFFPNEGVSQMQQLQMTTQTGKNVKVVAVQGNFDDTQNGVKKIFADDAIKKILAEKNNKLSSANSINWGRLVPQIVYYFSAYADLVNEEKISFGDEINFTVPTGNFGDILAGFYAKQMGLPIDKLICASNQNNILTDFLRTGYYDKHREFFKSISPSMDILISSNVERLLYHLTGDAYRVAMFMNSLQTEGFYDAGIGMIQRLQKFFWADFASEEETLATIKKVYDQENYVIDPHTAVAWCVAEKYQKRSRDNKPMVIVSTASPYKFNESVLKALGEKISSDCFENLQTLAEKNKVAPPKNLKNLQDAEILHKTICEKENMATEVLNFA